MMDDSPNFVTQEESLQSPPEHIRIQSLPTLSSSPSSTTFPINHLNVDEAKFQLLIQDNGEDATSKKLRNQLSAISFSHMI